MLHPTRQQIDQGSHLLPSLCMLQICLISIYDLAVIVVAFFSHFSEDGSSWMKIGDVKTLQHQNGKTDPTRIQDLGCLIIQLITN